MTAMQALEALQQEDMENGLEVNLVKWALGVDNDDPLPTQHSNWRVEETFINMCKARHEQLGSRLLSDGWGPNNPQDYGHYKLVAGSASFTCTHIISDKTKVIELPLSKKVIDQGELAVQNNFSPLAILVTKNGTQVNLLSCVKDEVDDSDIKVEEPEWQLDTVRFPLATGTPSKYAPPTKSDDGSSMATSTSPVPVGNGRAMAKPVATD